LPASVRLCWASRVRQGFTVLELFQEEEAHMQTSLIIESNGSGKEKLEALLREGWTVNSITPNHGKSYNDFLIILEK
jgi:hypothetical protein